MFYEMIEKITPPNWPDSPHSIRALRLRDGTQVPIPVIPQVHTLVTGNSGYGKTVFTQAYVDVQLEIDPNMFMVFFQVKPDDFTRKYLRPQDKVITFSPGACPQQNLFRWNLVREIRCHNKSRWDTVLKQIASNLFSDLLQDKRNQTWADGAQTTFECFVKTILYQYGNCPSNAKLIGAMKNMPRLDFLKHLAQYPPNRSMLKDNFEFDPDHCEHYQMPRKGSDILFFLQNVLNKFGGSFLSEDGEDTIFEYLSGRYGQRLFILHDHKERDSSKIFERFFLRYIGDDKISISSIHKGQMLWVLDEIDKVEADFGLVPAITLGRQFGLQMLISTQSTESLYAIAPDLHPEHLTNASMSGYSMLVAFHPGDTHTIQTMQTLFGKRRKQTMVMPLSRYDKPTVISELLPIVEDTDFASLDIGECYIKIRSAEPERVKILV